MRIVPPRRNDAHEGWSWSRMPSDFDQASWLLNHTSLLNEQRQRWEQQGLQRPDRRAEQLQPQGSSAVLAGKPDLVARRWDQITVIDAKTGRPSPAHTAQVLIYMYALPRALERYKGLSIAGQVAYPEHVVDIQANAVDGRFVQNLGGLIRRRASQMPARRVPSARACRFCEITPADCPERADEDPPEEGTTSDF